MENASESTEIEQTTWRIGKLKNRRVEIIQLEDEGKKYVLALLSHFKLQKLWPQSMVSG